MAVIASFLSACSAPSGGVIEGGPIGSDASEVIPSDRDLPVRAWTPAENQVPGSFGVPRPAGRLTLRDAVSRALAYNPAIKAAFFEIEARQGEAAQSSYKPNPELLLEVEDFAGSQDKSGFGAAEETLSLTQTIELGDKRLKRLQAAHLEASLAGWDFETIRMQVAAQAARAYLDVIAAQNRLNLLGDFVTIAEKTRSSVDARVTAGKASPIELDRAAVALARAKALEKAERARLLAAKRKLSSMWGADTVDFGSLSGRLGKGYAVPAIAVLKMHLENNPQLARWSDEISRRVAQVSLEQSKAVPDIKLGAGVRQSNETGSTAAVASVSVPLQLFDRNQGSIAAAERRVWKSENDQLAARTELYGSLVDALGELEVAAAELKGLERDVLPAAERAFDRTKIGYDDGKFDLLNVLDVQRTVFETRLDAQTARAEYEKARVKLEALVGRDVNRL